MKTAVILMAYGSPTNLEEVPEYLKGIYEGREVPDYAMRENMEKYRMVKGISPSNAIIDSVVTKLTTELSGYGDFRIMLGNKHWRPFLWDVIEGLKSDPPENIVGIPLFPFPSKNVLNSYLGPLREALEKYRMEPEVRMINGLDLEMMADLWAEIIHDSAPGDDEVVFFDAHSLPTFRNREDEYDSAFMDISRKIAQRLGLDVYFRGYQSVGKYGSSWLGPTVFDEFKKVDRGRYRSVLAAPVGFLYEHLEVLYDLDLEFGKETVSQSGMRYRRTRLPDDSEGMVNILRTHILKEVENIT